MRSLLLTAAATALLLSCNVKSDNGFSFNLTPKEGSGPVKTKQFKMDFDEIKVAQSINAQIVKANEEKVVVTAPADIIDEILVDNNGGKLFIHFKPNMNISARNVAVKIFAKDFSALEASSSARIKVLDKFTQERTDVKVSSSAEISGDLEANDISVQVSSSANFTAKIWAVNLKAEVSSSGDINISGKSQNADLDASSSGTLNAQKVVTQNAEAKASSSGDISISVSDRLNAAASSSGSIMVIKKGNLNILAKKESSGGSVTIK
ncbi:head GIN domain-containing protein [Kaistella palustris]|uniref:head GIN domain-containing protein n=1 Tax=Kaistella palustris TaxID=493376 RepID=UPI0004178C2F|nr:head GIN domain-containing protein [Kaistella palustris]